MSIAAALLAFSLQVTAPAQVAPPQPQYEVTDADFVARDVTFRSGEHLDEVRIHYATLGRPHRNRRGEIDNAVMLLHGTGGSGRQFLSPQFANELFGPGQPLDINRYWIILPDNIGHGRSSKPSDGLHMRFPAYDYDDMVALQHRLLTERLRVRHARLILGTSMGCMHAFVWGETYPDFARALMPLACEPVEIAGLNRMWRQAIIDGIRNDPAWANGEYTAQPTQGLRTAASILTIAGAAPLYFQAQWPTRDAATTEIRARIERSMASADANDMIYQFESSRNYNPWANLERITAPTMWVNSADDFINPRNFDYPQQAIARMGANARFRMIEESDQTRGHGTHTWARFWTRDLEELLARSEN
ncbi:MAG: alpha/beta fold hydrolase [Hyphomonadaceae bacterium]